MSIYAEYNDQNIVFAVTESAQPPTGRFIEANNPNVIGWVNNNGTLEPPVAPAPHATFGRLITVLAYSSRFTDGERIAIEMAAQGTGVAAASATSLLRRIGWANHVFLDDPRTVTETNALETNGLIGAGRAAEIIGDPVYSNEVIKEAREFYGLSLVPTAHELAQNGGKGYASPSEIHNA